MRWITTCALLLFAGRSHAQSTTFRALEAALDGQQVNLKVAVSQGTSATQIDFYAHKTLPTHRNLKLGVASTSGRPLGSLNPAAGKTVNHTFTVSLADLAKNPGVKPGDTLYLTLKCPQAGGHEWGVNGGSPNSDYSKGTSLVVPGTRNSRLRLPGRASAPLRRARFNSRRRSGRVTMPRCIQRSR